jgi:hypothetical protein
VQKKPSLYPTDEGCLICGSPYVVTHHILPGVGRRPISDREGCTCRLCNYHHNLSNNSVHMNRSLDLELRRDCQMKWEQREGVTDHEAFIRVFGESYL